MKFKHKLSILLFLLLFWLILAAGKGLVFFPMLILFVIILANYGTVFFGCIWVPSPKNIAKKMIDCTGAKPGDKIYDLGSGDGRIMIEASGRGIEANGIEIEPIKFVFSKIRISLLGIKNSRVLYGNFYNKNIGDAKAVTMFLIPSTIDKLAPKLKTLKKGTKIVSYQFPITGWKPYKHLKKDNIYVYKIR